MTKIAYIFVTSITFVYLLVCLTDNDASEITRIGNEIKLSVWTVGLWIIGVLYHIEQKLKKGLA